MPIKTAAWPIEALAFEEILTIVVESFLEEGRAFDWNRSATKQLYDRISEFDDSLPGRKDLLNLVRNLFGEFDCLAICSSAFDQQFERTQPSTNRYAVTRTSGVLMHCKRS